MFTIFGTGAEARHIAGHRIQLPQIARRMLRGRFIPVTRTAPEHRREQLGLVGFERGLPESNGDSIVQFIEAAESGDDSERDQLIAEVLKYNEEDLEATWAVFEWLRELARH